MRFDPVLREVHGPAGTVQLTPQQADILARLMRLPGSLVTRDTLMERLYGDRPDDPPNEKALDVAMHRLRRRLDSAGLRKAISCVWGDGFVWRGPVG